MHRRELLFAAAAALLAPAAGAEAEIQDTPFEASTVRTLARNLALQPYKAPDIGLPDSLKNLDYEAYRAIRFDPDKALWRGLNLHFTAEFFHRGFLFKDKVTIFQVVNGRAQFVPYSSDLFSFGKLTPPATNTDLGFAGFRIHYPLNRADYFDEVCAFLGASYFRAVAKGQGYGLSARGLAIKTANPSGEEFPLFKTFWLERPATDATSMVIHALLDSPSAAGAYRFTLRPGEATVFDTEMALYPRTDITEAGIAPQTTMFLFDAIDRGGFDDYRAEVHDSHGLLLSNGHGERIWRPLANPHDLQFSVLADTNPRGFGLMQRRRAFADYQDLEAHYEKRPSAWAEPIGDWGAGAVDLVEIPSKREVNDNVVTFWRPRDPLKAKGEYLMNYRLHWCWSVPGDSKLGLVAQTRAGLTFDQKYRLFIIDFVGGALKDLPVGTAPTLEASASAGKLLNSVVQSNPETGGWRVSVQLDPGSAKLVEMQAKLMNGEAAVTESWLYRWTL